MARRRAPSNRMKERARRQSIELLNLVPSIRFIHSLALRLRVERDCITSIAWILAYSMALEGPITDRAVRVWRRRVIDAVRHSPERGCYQCMSLDELDADVVGPIDDRTPEAIQAEPVSTESVASSDDDAAWPSEAIYQTNALAARLRVTRRHARRILARWRRQDEMRGEDM